VKVLFIYTASQLPGFTVLRVHIYNKYICRLSDAGVTNRDGVQPTPQSKSKSQSLGCSLTAARSQPQSAV